MSDASEADQFFRAADNAPVLIWRHDFNLAGSEAELTIRWGGGLLRRSSPGGGLAVVAWAAYADDPDADPDLVDTVVWEPSEADRRAIPVGRIATYALRRVVPRAGGEQRTYFTGYLIREA